MVGGHCTFDASTEGRPMAQNSSSRIDESSLTKGQRRKLNALRKSVGDEVGERAFAEWLSSRPVAKADDNAALIVDTLWPLVQQGTLAIPRGGYPAQARPRPDHRRAGQAVTTPRGSGRPRIDWGRFRSSKGGAGRPAASTNPLNCIANPAGRRSRVTTRRPTRNCGKTRPGDAETCRRAAYPSIRLYRIEKGR